LQYSSVIYGEGYFVKFSLK